MTNTPHSQKKKLVAMELRNSKWQLAFMEELSWSWLHFQPENELTIGLWIAMGAGQRGCGKSAVWRLRGSCSLRFGSIWRGVRQGAQRRHYSINEGDVSETEY
jgi:hypothetical protein